MQLTEAEYNQLPESLREELALAVRPNWGMFFYSEWCDEMKDLEVIEDTVFKSVLFRWLAGNEL